MGIGMDCAYFGAFLHGVLGDNFTLGWRGRGRGRAGDGHGFGLSTFDALLYILTLREQKLTMGIWKGDLCDFEFVFFIVTECI